jgi:hypothetical protein
VPVVARFIFAAIPAATFFFATAPFFLAAVSLAATFFSTALAANGFLAVAFFGSLPEK